jgi:hypothetical protein
VVSLQYRSRVYAEVPNRPATLGARPWQLNPAFTPLYYVRARITFSLCDDELVVLYDRPTGSFGATATDKIANFPEHGCGHADCVVWQNVA